MYQLTKKTKGKRRGWPRFRSQKQKWFSLLYDEPGKGFKVNGRTLRLSCGKDEDGKRIYVEAGLEKALDRFSPAKICQLRIVKDACGYHACFVVERAIKPIKPVAKVIAIDPNHKNLGYGVASDGSAIEIENPYFLKCIDRRIDAVKARRDRCKKRARQLTLPSGKSVWQPSRRWCYLNRVVENLYRKRREETKSFLYCLANELYRRYDLVAIGDYTPHGGGLNRGMRRSMNNQSLIGRFKHVLAWVALRGGKHYHEWPEHGSTITCHGCGEKRKDKLDPSIRSWACAHCHMHHIRDENAAQNGLRRTLRAKKHLLPGSGHLDELSLSRCTWRFNGLGIEVTLAAGVC